MSEKDVAALEIEINRAIRNGDDAIALLLIEQLNGALQRVALARVLEPELHDNCECAS